MKKKTKVLLEKVRPAALPSVPTAKAEDFKMGQINLGVSVPTGYNCEGILLEDVEVGHPIQMLRQKRQGIESAGIFESSIVNIIEDNLIYTDNSIYRITELDK